MHLFLDLYTSSAVELFWLQIQPECLSVVNSDIFNQQFINSRLSANGRRGKSYSDEINCYISLDNTKDIIAFSES